MRLWAFVFLLEFDSGIMMFYMAIGYNEKAFRLLAFSECELMALGAGSFGTLNRKPKKRTPSGSRLEFV